MDSRNWQLRLLAPAEQELFGDRGRASSENQCTLICQADTLNLHIPIDGQQLAGDDVAASRQAYAALSSALAIILSAHSAPVAGSGLLTIAANTR